MATWQVLGKTYKSKGFHKKTRGRNQLRDLIEDLCDSEECQQFISWKLCRHFICDDPEPEMISIVTDAWKKSKGMLPEIHQAVLDATWKFGQNYNKFLSPETWLIQIARMTGADWPGDPEIFKYDFKSKLNYKQKKIKNILAELGQLPFRAKQPNGFPDTINNWLSQEYLVRRIALINNPTQIGLYKNSVSLFDISKRVVEQNFDNPEILLKILNNLYLKNEQAKSLIAILCSRKVLKV